MNVTISLWIIPAVVTILSLLWAFFWPANDNGYLGGIVRLFMLIPALAISLISWIIFAIF